MAKMPDIKVKVVWEDTPLTRAIAEEAVKAERIRIAEAVRDLDGYVLRIDREAVRRIIWDEAKDG